MWIAKFNIIPVLRKHDCEESGMHDAKTSAENIDDNLRPTRHEAFEHSQFSLCLLVPKCYSISYHLTPRGTTTNLFCVQVVLKSKAFKPP